MSKVDWTRMNLRCFFRVFVTKKSDVPPGSLPVFLECAHGNGPIWFPSFGFNVWIDAVLLAVQDQGKDMQKNDLFDLMMMLSSRYLVSKYGKDFEPVVLQVGCMYLLECQEGSM